MKIVADNTVPYLKGILEPIADVVYLPAEEFTPDALHDADALIVRSIDKCTRNLLSGSKIKLITTATIGFDHIDTQFCAEAGITWKNAPGCNAVSVSQYILGALADLSLKTNKPLAGKTIGIVGVGHVGKKVEKVCSAIGMNVLRNDPPREEIEGKSNFVSLNTIAEKSDIITFHTPLIKEGKFATRHLADTIFFKKLKRQPWYINASRGAVHDTEALLKAYQNGQISEMVIDCWENEPDISRELLKSASIATPHIAGFSADGKANGTRICLENIATFFHLSIDKIVDVIPPVPLEPIIDMNMFASNRIEQALLKPFNPLVPDKALRAEPEKFEWFRANFHHHREFHAYTIANATLREAALLQQLGFIIKSLNQ
ncbi:MAG: 4-phosphoerythronate dehydrogenase PdxB [Parabacteroides sp.]|nr:4-phosphoerythronate dehydrogenase PdxB [Bacteroidaceae bacterium]MDD4591374.1 4-phosphoerythronate dehydrogenase PdxB [Parabacteroides sp.]